MPAFSGAPVSGAAGISAADTGDDKQGETQNPEKQITEGQGETTDPTEPVEFDAKQTDDGYSKEYGYFVKLSMTGATKYTIKEPVPDEEGNVVEELKGVFETETESEVKELLIPNNKPSKLYELKVYNEKNECIDVYLRTVSDMKKVELYKWFYNKNKAWIKFSKAGYAEGVNILIEKKSGSKFKKSKSKNVSFTASKYEYTGTYTEAIKSIKGGAVQRIKIRTYIKINGKKKYGPWSEPVYFASPKSAKIYSKDHKIYLTGLKITGAKKTVIYMSKKSKKGYNKVKTIKAGTKKCKFSMIDGREFDGKKKYYVKLEYYYKVGKKTVKSVIQGKAGIVVSLYNVKVGPIRVADRVS